MGLPDDTGRLEELIRILARTGPIGATGPAAVPNTPAFNAAIAVTPGMSPYQATANQNLHLYLASGPITVLMPPNPTDGQWLRAKDKQGQSTVNPATFLVSTPNQLEDPNNPGAFLASIAFLAVQGGTVTYGFTSSIKEWILW
jgi:hypothetical protein